MIRRAPTLSFSNQIFRSLANQLGNIRAATDGGSKQFATKMRTPGACTCGQKGAFLKSLAFPTEIERKMGDFIVKMCDENAPPSRTNMLMTTGVPFLYRFPV